jgi:molecular chaperone DnaK (HSP70)
MLSETDVFVTELEDDMLFLSKQQFEELIQPLVHQTIQCCAAALKDAGLEKIGYPACCHGRRIHQDTLY